MNDLTATEPSVGASFNEITQLTITARQRAVQAVNTELIELHWQVGAYISRKIEAAEWGMEWSLNWLLTSRVLNRDCAVLPEPISFACASFTRHTDMTQLSQHCCDNCPGPKT